MGAQRRAAELAGLFVLPACGLVSYEPNPLDVAALSEQISTERIASTDRVRRATSASSAPSLGDLISIRLRRDPEIRAQRSDVRVAAALVDVPTPLADPNLSVGANLAIGSSVTDDELAIPAVQASVPIPLLSNRRARRDARNEAQLRVAEAQLRRAERRAALDTRARWVAAAMAEERVRVRESVAALAQELVRSAESLVAAGGATALDVALLRLEATAAERAVFDAGIEADTARAELADALVLPPSAFDGLSLFDGDSEHSSSDWVAEIDTPRDSWNAEAHRWRTDLSLFEARYAAAEAQLALAVARQVQDVNINASFGPEPAETFRIVGLAIAGALPIFARNGQNIATAFAHRTRAKVALASGLDRIAIDVASALATVDRAERQSVYVQDQLVPASDELREAASLAVGAGTASALSLLSATRSRADVTLDVLSARQALVRAWLDVETAVERPVLALPGTNAGADVAWPLGDQQDSADWEQEMWNVERSNGDSE